MTSPVLSSPPSQMAPPMARHMRDASSKPKSGAGQGIDLRSLAKTEVAVPIAVLGILMAMVAPLPPFLIDLLISTNITISTVILLVSMYIRKPSEFTVFPTTLLLMTLFRLALNVSSSRLILLNGNTGHIGGRRGDRVLR